MFHHAMVWLVISAGLLLAVGCRGTTDNVPDVQVDMTLGPSPPQVGTADASLKLADRNGAPLTGAAVRLEGNMNHAGMKPSFADLHEVEPGRYSGKLEFTMGGDWFVLVTVQTSDGTTVQRKIDVPGVEAP